MEGEIQAIVSREAFGGLSPDDERIVRLFAGLCRRSTAIVKPTPFNLADKLTTQDGFIIASISLALDPEKDFQLREPRIGGIDYSLRALRSQEADRLQEVLSKDVQLACVQGAKLICVNELGFPLGFSESPGEMKSRKDGLFDLYKGLAQKHNAYIIAGTHPLFQ